MWTAGALASETRPYSGDVWRVVENQWRASTLRLTDSLDEQAILEHMLEQTKPRLPPETAGLHFLLAAPFRYAPYPEGSRFRRANQPEGVFYAAEHPDTAIAETAFYRLLFFTRATNMVLPANPVEHTCFSAGVAHDQTIDLIAPPLDRDKEVWTHPTNYAAMQDLADAARGATIAIIRYQSARDRLARVNIALLTPKAFAKRAPRQQQSWHLFVRRHAVQAWCEHPARTIELGISDFLSDPRLAL